METDNIIKINTSNVNNKISSTMSGMNTYLPTPPLGQDMTEGQLF